jgi:putative peptide zinc metalloprotease protein
MAPGLWRVLQLMDGRRTLDEIWATASAWSAEAGAFDPAEPGDTPSPLSQTELVQLMASLHGNDLLQTQVPPDAGEVFERWQRQSRQRFKQTWMNPLNIRLPLLHPDAWFSRRAGMARALVSWPVFGLWLALVLPAAMLMWQHWAALTENLSDRVLAGSNVVLLWFVYPLVKAVHECAHGLAVKAFGGTVREIGLMFMVLTPVPYVDASSSYAFPSKWARITVAAAGVMAEMLLGALALFVWLMAEPGLVTAVAFNVVLIAGVSTLLVNGNPLMRYDGYFMACDLLEVPNLGQRATQYWVYLIDRWGFGARDAQPPLKVRGERMLLAVYGLVSPVYRLFITFGLIWFVASEYLFVGAVMALMALWSAVPVPLWKAWKHLRQSASLALRREQALRRSGAGLALLLLLVLAVPMPFHSVHHAVVWVPDEALVRAGADGDVRGAPVAPGQAVRAGQTLAQLDNPLLVAEAGLAGAGLGQVQAQLRRAEVESRPKAEALRGELASREARLAEAQTRLAALDVKAVVSGRWVPRAPTELPGRHVKRGEILGYVVSDASQVLRIAVPQEDMDLIRERLQQVEVRLAQQPREVIGARLARAVPGGDSELVSAALGTSGGGEVAVDPAKPGGTHALRRVFDLELRLDRASPTVVFGDRAYVRFDLGAAPLAWQAFVRLRQLFLSRLNV